MMKSGEASRFTFDGQALGADGGPSALPARSSGSGCVTPSRSLRIEPDEFLGLSALVEMDRAADTDSDTVSKAKVLMRTALAEKLQEAGLPWAPSAEAASKRAAAAAEPASVARELAGNEKARKGAAYVAAAALAVALWGGYIRGWHWTGFRANGQLWDWLNLLLLPAVLGTIPLWVQDKEYIGKGRRVAYAVAIVAWTGFVIAGYLIPLSWTGFRGQTLWDWLQLLVLPAAVTTTMTLISMRVQEPKAGLRPYQKAVIAALSAGWAVTVIGGYVLRWKWTGYAGNSLWDWFQMLLPLVFPAILLPSLLKWISGNAAGRAAAAHEAAVARTAAGGTSP
jgi:hypothetical protein